MQTATGGLVAAGGAAKHEQISTSDENTGSRVQSQAGSVRAGAAGFVTGRAARSATAG